MQELFFTTNFFLLHQAKKLKVPDKCVDFPTVVPWNFCLKTVLLKLAFSSSTALHTGQMPFLYPLYHWFHGFYPLWLNPFLVEVILASTSALGQLRCPLVFSQNSQLVSQNFIYSHSFH